jgi:hypothetical protein
MQIWRVCIKFSIVQISHKFRKKNLENNFSPMHAIPFWREKGYGMVWIYLPFIYKSALVRVDISLFTLLRIAFRISFEARSHERRFSPAIVH